MEYRLKTPLIHRTTRKWSLTEAGEDYFQQAKNILDDVSSLNARVTGTPERLEGKLKVSAPISFGNMYLMDVIDEFANQHPDLTIHIDLTDRQVDLVEEGYEVAIRISELRDSSLRVREIQYSGAQPGCQSYLP